MSPFRCIVDLQKKEFEMKKIIASFAMVLMAFVVSNSAAADETIVGKVVGINSCQSSEPEGYFLVTLDNGNVYRLKANNATYSSISAMRRNLFSTLLVAYEREYTISLTSNETAVTKCSVSTSGMIFGLSLEKSLN